MAGKAEATQTGGRPATSGTIKGRYGLSVGNPNTPLPSGWQWTALSSVARLETGHTPSRRHPEWWGGDIPWIGIRDATANHGRVIYGTREFTNKLGIEHSSARILPANTVCLSRTASVGYVVVMGVPMATSQDFVNWVCSDRLNHHFLKYVLLAEKDAILQYASGTTHQTIYFPEAKAFHVALPSVREQDAIANLLGSLDDKIELNRRMAATLEEMARALFKNWFVDFGPVRAKTEGRATGLSATTTALFPDRFGEDGLPEGWAEQSLLDQATWINGAAYKDMHFSDASDALPVIKITELKNGITDGTKWTNTDLGDRYRIKEGELLFSWSGSPDTSIDTFIWVHGEAWLNQHVFAVRANGQASEAMLFAMLKFFKPILIEIARDKQTTGLGHVTRQDMARMKVCVGEPRVRAAFDHIAEPLFSRLKLVLKESARLAAIRDTLLPKLISGELRIKDAEATVVAA